MCLWASWFKWVLLLLSVTNRSLLCQQQKPLCPRRYRREFLYFIRERTFMCFSLFSNIGKYSELTTRWKTSLQNRYQFELTTFIKVPITGCSRQKRWNSTLSLCISVSSKNSPVSGNCIFNLKNSGVNNKHDRDVYVPRFFVIMLFFSVLVKKYHEGSCVTLCISRRSKKRGLALFLLRHCLGLESPRNICPWGCLNVWRFFGDAKTSCRKMQEKMLLFFSLT